MATRAAAPVPELLALTAHPVRWRLVSELARGDRQVRELVAATGEKQSLTSYHLGRLRRGGLVTARRSSADARDFYYRLDLAELEARLGQVGQSLHPGLAPARPARPPSRAGSRPRVLFLCTGNSARSQMAAALLEQLAGERVEVASAGSHPKPMHPDVVRVMAERGVDVSSRRPTHVDTVLDRPFDHVVTLCDRVREVCPEFPSGPSRTHWSLADPSAQPDRVRALRETADELTERLRFFVGVLGVTAVEHTDGSST